MFIRVILAVSLLMAVEPGALASTSRDMDLRDLVTESNAVVLGRVTAIQPTGVTWVTGAEILAARVRPTLVVRGQVVGDFVVLFLNSSDEAILDPSADYVLFLTLAERLGVELPKEFERYFRVTGGERGTIHLQDGTAFTGALLGEPVQQRTCDFVVRINEILPVSSSAARHCHFRDRRAHKRTPDPTVRSDQGHGAGTQ
jgi:hypothetical protein